MLRAHAQNLEYHLLDFAKDLFHLDGENVCIAGSFALQLHGLETWDPEDLDVVIFRPMPFQEQYVEKNMEVCEHYGDAEPEHDRKVYQLERNGKKMNIILYYASEIPENLLTYGKMKVNSVRNIIEAKNSYGYASQEKKYIRRKDAVQLGILKNLNFNLNP